VDSESDKRTPSQSNLYSSSTVRDNSVINGHRRSVVCSLSTRTFSTSHTHTSQRHQRTQTQRRLLTLDTYLQHITHTHVTVSSTDTDAASSAHSRHVPSAHHTRTRHSVIEGHRRSVVCSLSTRTFSTSHTHTSQHHQRTQTQRRRLTLDTYLSHHSHQAHITVIVTGNTS